MIHQHYRTEDLYQALTSGIHACSQHVLGINFICEVSVYVVEITIMILGVMLLYLGHITLNLP